MEQWVRTILSKAANAPLDPLGALVGSSILIVAFDTAGNGSGWAFAGVPMASGGLQNPSRQLGGNVSFAQSLSGSQPATPLDLSEFPSLSGNSQLSNQSQSSMWSTGGARNLGGPAPIQRNQPTPLSQQQNQQEDMYTPPSRLPTDQGSFRFGNQASIGQTVQSQQNAVDDFPPLNRNPNGEIGRERGGPSLMSSLGFAPPSGNGTASAQQPSRAANGLLNALSANSRASETRSPADARDEDSRQKGLASQKSPLDGLANQSEGRHPGTIGNSALSGKAKAEEQVPSVPVQDPLAGMPESDKWGIKGLRFLMNGFPDYNALVSGIDYTNMGLEQALRSPEPISEQIYSAFDDTPPRPAIPKFRLPECYKVNNVQPIENKIQGFNEETLMWIFYSCPGDRQQQLAALELNNRNWRWHKKLQVWLTKDEHMMPQVISPNHERGYYLVWDTTQWRKDRHVSKSALLHSSRLGPRTTNRSPSRQEATRQNSIPSILASSLTPQITSLFFLFLSFVPATMANDEINVPSLVLVLVVSGLIIRYLFFSAPVDGTVTDASGSGRAAAGRGGDLRTREAAVERIQQMFPQVDRRMILWDLQRTGGNLTATTDRILAGRLETPPVTFQPPPPPPSATAASTTGSSATAAARAADKPAQPDLITRYKLHDKLESASTTEEDKSGKGGKAWSTSRDERQALLQRRRDEMILAARRKMEAKIAAEKAAASAGGAGSS
ncbi:hypothetical protein PpBr36_04655 [Pyricularia pennisetigena]|uniref:hypothetical protein n=1 Tax=Pyricularia pennisetigena TaxID=1578925 RepID=UPI00114EA0E6|nr:hypothetical protein PpBr36_04655 [Pyricularia pennisetigena]TLS26908.1 hypothetical protein PpBr36_04655 [Pyricularia pennisetigena]